MIKIEQAEGLPEHLKGKAHISMEVWAVTYASENDIDAHTKPETVAYIGFLPFCISTDTRLVWFHLENPKVNFTLLRNSRPLADAFFDHINSSWIAAVAVDDKKALHFARYLGFEFTEKTYNNFMLFRRS